MSIKNLIAAAREQNKWTDGNHWRDLADAAEAELAEAEANRKEGWEYSGEIEQRFQAELAEANESFNNLYRDFKQAQARIDSLLADNLVQAKQLAAEPRYDDVYAAGCAALDASRCPKCDDWGVGGPSSDGICDCSAGDLYRAPKPEALETVAEQEERHNRERRQLKQESMEADEWKPEAQTCPSCPVREAFDHMPCHVCGDTGAPFSSQPKPEARACPACFGVRGRWAAKGVWVDCPVCNGTGKVGGGK